MTISGAPWVIERTTQELCKSAHIRSSKCTFTTEGIVTRAAGHCQLRRKTWPLLSRSRAWPSKNYTNRTTDGLANAVLQTAKPLVVAPRRKSCRAETAVAPKKLLREKARMGCVAETQRRAKVFCIWIFILHQMILFAMPCYRQCLMLTLRHRGKLSEWKFSLQIGYSPKGDHHC